MLRPLRCYACVLAQHLVSKRQPDVELSYITIGLSATALCITIFTLARSRAQRLSEARKAPKLSVLLSGNQRVLDFYAGDNSIGNYPIKLDFFVENAGDREARDILIELRFDSNLREVPRASSKTWETPGGGSASESTYRHPAPEELFIKYKEDEQGRGIGFVEHSLNRPLYMGETLPIGFLCIEVSFGKYQFDWRITSSGGFAESEGFNRLFVNVLPHIDT